MAGFTSFVILAEMRTGSNFLESNLNAIPGLRCHGELFNPYFIGSEGKDELFGITLAERSADPARLLAASREGEALSGFRYFHDHDPRVFDMVMDDPTCAKIVLNRNALEAYVSWKIARESDQWWLANTKHLQVVRPVFDADEFAARTAEVRAQQERIRRRLQKSGQTAFRLDYEDIRDRDVLNGIAAYLGVEGRLKRLVHRFKKQNPEAIREKVANPGEMEAALAKVDWFGVDHVPDFEPRRTGAVAKYLACDAVGLLFMPVRGGPEARVAQWLGQYGKLQTDFDRKRLRRWKEAHAGQRSFAVLRHPVARAYAAWCGLLEREWMPELRPYLKRVHRFELPPEGQGFATVEAHRAGFLVFLEFIRYLLEGRTELRVPARIATQGAVIRGFADLQSPDMLIREARLEDGLRCLVEEAGLPFHPLPGEAEPLPWSLSEICDEEIEAAARAAYWRDYVSFGFEPWTPA